MPPEQLTTCYYHKLQRQDIHTGSKRVSDQLHETQLLGKSPASGFSESV